MRWIMLPASAAAHVAAFLLTLIIPLATGVDAPAPWPASRLPDFLAASPVPPPPELRRISNIRAVSSAAPISAADHIGDSSEPPVSPGSFTDGIGDPTGAVAGVPEGLTTDPVPDVVLPLPPSPPAPQAYRPGGAIREPRKIKDAAPTYPDIARAARIEGVVILEATIDERGVVSDARVLRSIPLLDNAALAALRQWRYTPTLLNGIPVRVLMTVTFRFSLGDRDL